MGRVSLWPLVVSSRFWCLWKQLERENRKLYLLCKQLIILSISTLLPYHGDRNLIIQTHANVTILVFTYSLLITMPLTLCNLLCELGHIKHIILITTSHGTTEDRTRIIGVWKETCWGLHCCKAKAGCQTQWLWLAGNWYSSHQLVAGFEGGPQRPILRLDY